MKKFISVILSTIITLTTVAFLTACDDAQETKPKTNDSNVSTTAPDGGTTESEKKNNEPVEYGKCSEMVIDPSEFFTKGELDIDSTVNDESKYRFNVEDADMEEFIAYMDAYKKSDIFVKVKSESDSSYLAETEDGEFEISLYINTSNNFVSFFCDRTYENLDVKYADMIPDPKKVFENGKVSVSGKDGGSEYFFSVTDYTEEEIEEYISGCQEKGFTNISYDGYNKEDRLFISYTEDSQYFVKVSLENKRSTVYVTCGYNKNK